MADRIEGFTFFASYLDAAELLPDEADRAAFIMAVCRYGLTGEDPELSGVPAALFTMARPSLDNSRVKVFAGKKSGQARREQKKNRERAECEQSANRERAECEQSANTIDYRIKTIEKDSEEKEEKRHFVPPSVDEVRDYCLEKGYTRDNINPDEFVDFYESKGWVVGKTKMRDWKAAVRNWVRRDKSGTKSTGSTGQNFVGRGDDKTEIQNELLKRQYAASKAV